jgi:hypothetical protein
VLLFSAPQHSFPPTLVAVPQQVLVVAGPQELRSMQFLAVGPPFLMLSWLKRKTRFVVPVNYNSLV